MEHGRRYSYINAGCRCDLCRGWNAKNAREYRKRRMARTGEYILHGKFYKKVESDESSRRGILGENPSTGENSTSIYADNGLEKAYS